RLRLGGQLRGGRRQRRCGRGRRLARAGDTGSRTRVLPVVVTRLDHRVVVTVMAVVTVAAAVMGQRRAGEEDGRDNE
ncbi:hypothetical protein, partial [Mycobacterium talmoniae]|uniref:hypothetical protein n=1 Tax=Mycobacterium talmoniae TaxID=1858794 RepID=UPI001A9754EB